MYYPCSFSECDCFTKHSVNDCYGNSSLVDGRMSGRLVEDGGGYKTCGSGQDGTCVGWEEDSCREFHQCSEMEIHFHVTEWKSANSRLCLSTLALNQGPQTCQVGLSSNTASGQPLKVPWETVMRDSWSLTWKLGKHGCDDLIWPADGSR